jgi:hypothetical protein
MPSDRRARSILRDQNLLQIMKNETGSSLNFSANLAQKWRDWICGQRFMFTVIVAPPERHDAPLTFKSVKLELLEGKRCDLCQQAALLV